jgi:hypothetical protein
MEAVNGLNVEHLSAEQRMEMESRRLQGVLIRHLEEKYLKENRRSTYTVLENTNTNYYWNLFHVMMFDRMWEAGIPFEDIAGYFNRKPYEVALLMIDREIQGKIKPRRGGLMGSSIAKRKFQRLMKQIEQEVLPIEQADD